MSMSDANENEMYLLNFKYKIFSNFIMKYHPYNYTMSKKELIFILFNSRGIDIRVGQTCP
jgi:hypothetical protein